MGSIFLVMHPRRQNQDDSEGRQEAFPAVDNLALWFLTLPLLAGDCQMAGNSGGPEVIVNSLSGQLQTER